MVIGNRSWDLTILWSGGITARSLDKTVSSQWDRPIERMGCRVNRIEHIHGGYIVQHIHTEKEIPLRGVHMDTNRTYRAKIYTWRGDTHGGAKHGGGDTYGGRYTWKRVAQKRRYIWSTVAPGRY